MISTDRFLYSKETKTFVIDISDLGSTYVFDRIYSDAADEGITLYSEKSGLEATYYLDHCNYDHIEGEVVSWELKPTTETIRKHPQLRDTTVLIFND